MVMPSFTMLVIHSNLFASLYWYLSIRALEIC